MGWSIGGVLAYEMAQQLSRQGQMVAHLIMLDTSAPAPARKLQPKSALSDWLRRIVSWPPALAKSLKALLALVKPTASYVHSGLFLLAASARRKHAPSGQKPTTLDLLRWAAFDTWRTRLLKDAEVAATVTQETSLLLVEMPAVRRVLHLVREHRRIARRYSAVAYSGHITLIRALTSDQDESSGRDPTLGWGMLAEGGVEIHNIRANHVALLARPYVKTLAQELRSYLDRSCQSPRK
jgi:thioesterase domain-containing protein